MNKIPIFFCFDKNMVMPAGVCITSMLLNKHTNTYYDFFILYNEENLSSEYRSQILKIQDFYSKDCRVSFFNVGESFKNAYEVRNITVSTYYRLLVPELIDQINSLHQTDYQTIIYLDVDTIIECDLSAVLALAQSKVDTCLLGVCESPTYCNVNTSYWGKIGCDPSSYINAGVLIMNIPALQKMNFTSQCLLHKNKKYTYQDQDIINIVCKGKIEFLPLKYNYTSLLYSLSIENEKFKNIKAKEIAECSNCIIHYTGNKPWNNFCLRAEYWWYYYKHSIFKDENFYIRNYQVMSKKILLDYSYKEVKKIFLKKFKAKYFHIPKNKNNA